MSMTIGRCSLLEDPAGGTFQQQGNIVSFTNELGRVTSYEYDALNRRVAIVKPSVPGLGLARTETAYDTSGNVVLVADALGNETSFEYDSSAAFITL